MRGPLSRRLQERERLVHLGRNRRPRVRRGRGDRHLGEDPLAGGGRRADLFHRHGVRTAAIGRERGDTTYAGVTMADDGAEESRHCVDRR